MTNNRMPDEIAGCNRIRSARREERNYARRFRKVKPITTQLEMVGGRMLSSHLAVSANSKTGAIGISSHSLVFWKQRIHPTTHEERQCGSEKAQKMLDDARRYSKEGSQRRRAKAKGL